LRRSSNSSPGDEERRIHSSLTGPLAKEKSQFPTRTKQHKKLESLAGDAHIGKGHLPLGARAPAKLNHGAQRDNPELAAAPPGKVLDEKAAPPGQRKQNATWSGIESKQGG